MTAPAIHPGRLLKRELNARSLSANRLALDLGVPSGRITDILNGRRSITADTAVRLGRYFGNSAQFWLYLLGHNPLSGNLAGQYQSRGFFRRTMELSGGAAARFPFQSLADNPSVSDLA